jgi:hypothetical protein
MSLQFAAEKIRLNAVDLASAAGDPSSGGGFAAAIGSLYLRSGTAGIYAKTGAGDAAWSQLRQGFNWYSVRDFGATGNGSTDDRAAIQAAITACVAAGGGRVFFPAGTYACGKGAGAYSFLLHNVSGVIFCGEGPTSVIKQSGNAGAAAWSLFSITGTSQAVRFCDLRFDGSGLSNPGASNNHLVSLGDGTGAVTEPQFFRCVFGGMIAGSGDGLLVTGAAGDLVTRLWVTNCVFDGIGRYGIHLTAGIQYAFVTQNFLANATSEIVMDGSGAIQDSIVILGNELDHAGAGVYAASIVGDASTFWTNSTFSQNVILNGFVALGNLARVTCVGNVQTSGSYATAAAAFTAELAVTDVTIAQNLIARAAGSSAGPCLALAGAGGVGASRTRLGSNVLVNDTAAGLISVVDATGCSVGNNILRSSSAAGYAIDVQQVAVAGTDLLVQGNNTTASSGNFAAGCRLFTNGAAMGNAMVAGNLMDQVNYGLRVEKSSGNFTGRYHWGNNVANSNTGDVEQVGAPGIALNVGWNTGTFGAQLFAGTGSPEGVITARIGSMYMRTDGAPGSTCYVKESGTGAAGWTAIAGQMIVFGAGDLTTAATRVFMGAGYIATATATEVQIAITRAGTIRNLRVQVAAAGTDAQAVTFTVRKNGADTALACSLSNDAAGGASDVADSFAVAAGDLLSLGITKAAPVTAGQTFVQASCELA